MSDHQFDLLTRRCLGCDIDASADWPSLKDAEMRRIDMREKISARDFERDQAGSGNRKARRATEAKARRAR
jgi:hypothetical protein